MLSLNDLIGQRDFWVFVFVLGGMLLNWPLLALADGSILLGMPAILVYVAAIWLLIIILLYLFDRGNSD